MGVDVDLAPPIVLVPGHNCASPRCLLAPIEPDDSSSWLVPLGTRSQSQAQMELEKLAACVSGLVEEEVGEGGGGGGGSVTGR